MREIIFYNLHGEIKNREQLNHHSIAKCNGMKIKCWLKDESQKVGFADVFRIHDNNEYNEMIKDYINLCTYDHLDEERNQLVGDDDSKYNQTYIKIAIDDIEKIEAILHSNPRWGTRLTNKFQFMTKN